MADDDGTGVFSFGARLTDICTALFEKLGGLPRQSNTEPLMEDSKETPESGRLVTLEFVLFSRQARLRKVSSF